MGLWNPHLPLFPKWPGSSETGTFSHSAIMVSIGHSVFPVGFAQIPNEGTKQVRVDEGSETILAFVPLP